MTVLEILEDVLQGHDLVGPALEVNVSARLRKREFTVQYNETDLNFITRLLEDEGIFYYFDHSGSEEKLCIADGVGNLKALPETPSLDYHAQEGLKHMQKDHIFKVRRTQQFVTRSTLVKDYNERTPSADIRATHAGASGFGERHVYAPGARDVEAAVSASQILSERFQSEKVLLTGEGVAISMRSGFTFRLEDGRHGPFEGHYLLMRVEHHGDQREGFEGQEAKLIYHNRFVGVPGNTDYRPAARSRKPQIAGVLTARVDGPESDYAYLDEDGRYRVKLPFDLSDRKDGNASLPIRLIQPYGGSQYGTHFPLHRQNDVILAFIGGDIDRPIALGAMPNPSQASPVNSSNRSQSMLRTASGHEFRLDDLEGKTVIQLLSSGGHSVTINDDPANCEIRLETKNKYTLVLDDKNLNTRLLTPGGQVLLMDDDKTRMTLTTAYGHRMTLDDESKSVAVQTGKGHVLRLDDENEILGLQDVDGKHSLELDIAGGKIGIKTEGDMELSAKGSFTLQASEIHMEAVKQGIELKAAKDLVLDGLNVSAKAGKKLALEGAQSANLKGLATQIEATKDLNLKGGMTTKISGVQASLEAQLVAQIKGTQVFIN
jgi:type VI secretion system secreted protein VgrG